ncbi:DUF6635 family protein [Pararhodospirillum photometricum]|uniref:Uncharacterized protein n=1 Tax=Pararhodospirillum photometricum DSM 122 TaxID=1150469 RepID=H6SJI2_PARPM|nr:DUF6635 family protein [Pararhodospirillum photometricum]CCG08147.1 Putative uncharacterized protein [Pararhodospirillum photometricum DSM 122]
MSPLPALSVSAAAVEAAVDCAAVRYVAARRERVESFVDATYSWGPSLDLHRHALGWDVARAPLNALLAVPQVSLMASARGLEAVGRHWRPAGRLGTRLGRLTLMLPTDVGREISFRLYRDFLELPFEAGGGRVTTRDALAEAVLSEPLLAELALSAARAVAARGDDPVFRARLTAALKAYVGGRAAAADMVSTLACLGAGMAVTHHLTPGTWGLSTALAGMVAQKLAVASFPLGPGVGALWHGVMPAAASGAVLAASAATVMSAAAVVGAFAGVVADPLQRALGLHQRRLHRLVDTLEADLRGDGDRPLVLRDHYVARVFDLVDLLVAVHRVAGGRGAG